jgi:hypothetical protein
MRLGGWRLLEMPHVCADCKIEITDTPFILGKKRRRIVCKKCHDRLNPPCRYCGKYESDDRSSSSNEDENYDEMEETISYSYGTTCEHCGKRYFNSMPKKKGDKRRPFLQHSSLTRFEYFLVRSWEDTIDYFAIYELSGPDHFYAMQNKLRKEMTREPKIYVILWKLINLNQRNLALQYSEKIALWRKYNCPEDELRAKGRHEYKDLRQCERFSDEFRDEVERLTKKYGKSCLV